MLSGVVSSLSSAYFTWDFTRVDLLRFLAEAIFHTETNFRDWDSSCCVCLSKQSNLTLSESFFAVLPVANRLKTMFWRHLRASTSNLMPVSYRLQSLAAFSKRSSFATVIKFLDAIGSCSWFLPDLNAQTDHIKEFYNSCKAAFSAERSHWLVKFFNMIGLCI